MKVKIRYILIAALIVAGAGVAFFVPFNKITATAKRVTAPIEHVFSPKELLRSTEGAEKLKAAPAPVVTTSSFDAILNFGQRILGFASTILGLFLGFRTLKGGQKAKVVTKTRTIIKEVPAEKPKRRDPARLTSRPK